MGAIPKLLGSTLKIPEETNRVVSFAINDRLAVMAGQEEGETNSRDQSR